MTNTTLRLALAALLATLLASGCEIADPPPVEPLDSELRPDRRDTGTPACSRVGQVAVPEECNAFDDDCDGTVDERVCDDPCDVFDTAARSRSR